MCGKMCGLPADVDTDQNTMCCRRSTVATACSSTAPWALTRAASASTPPLPCPSLRCRPCACPAFCPSSRTILHVTTIVHDQEATLPFVPTCIIKLRPCTCAKICPPPRTSSLVHPSEYGQIDLLICAAVFRFVKVGASLDYGINSTG